MQFKNAIAIVHMMVGMSGIHNYMCVIWNTDVGRMLEYSTLLLVHAWRLSNSSSKVTINCGI